MTGYLDLSIEVAHIYTNQQPGPDQQAGIAVLADDPRARALTDAAATTQTVVLLDDYTPQFSPAPTVLDFDAYRAWLHGQGVPRAQLVYEAALVDRNLATLDAIGNPRLRRQLERYIDAHGQHPCSLFVATWYLARLGLGVTVPGVLPARRLLTILPEHFREYEDRAHDIIAAVAGREALARIETIFFPDTRAACDTLAWDDFDPDAYLLNNYVDLLPADVYSTLALARRLRARAPVDTLLDLGTGPNLLPVLAALPYVGRVVAREPGRQNRAYLDAQRARLDVTWEPAIAILRAVDPALADFDYQRALATRLIVREGDHTGIPARAYDAVTMHYVAEGAGDDPRIFTAITRALVAGAKPGALVFACFMEGSQGYTLDGTAYRALDVDSARVRAALVPGVADLTIDRLDASAGPARHGYTGHLIAAGTREG